MLKYLMVTATLLTLGQPVSYSNSRPTPLNPSLSADCALIVMSEHKRRSDTSLNGIRYFANFIPGLKVAGTGEYGDICITYEDISQAAYEARRKIGEVPKEIYELSSVYPEAEHIAVSAEIIQETTRILAHRFQLSRDTIIHALPRIDTSKTSIKEICPTFLKPVKCELSRYRTLTGMCNNLEHPSWGSARSAMVRYLPPEYADAIQEPRKSVDGSDLPSARIVSFMMHHDVSEHHSHINILLVFWGQMTDHDMTLAAQTVDHEKQDIECCKFPPEHQHPNCMNIKVPHDDPFYKYFKRQCLDFARIYPGPKPGCKLGPRFQINTISSYIDGNFVYGSTQDVASRLREFHGGRLKTNQVYAELGLKDLLPMKMVEKDVGCMARPRNVYCFDAGDERVNEQLMLTVMHTMMMREHNRVADILSHVNPHWDDETIYQEARHIVAAEIQHITYSQFLPMVIGKQTVMKYGIEPLKHGYFDGYSPKVNAGIRAAFQSAAFRFGHSLLPDVIERYNKFHEKIDSLRVSTVLRQPFNLYKPGIVDTFLLGLINQKANAMDPEVTTEVTNHLFEKPGEGFGMDLAAMNVQRAREHGVPGYIKYREYCGMPRVRNFWDLIGILPNKTVHRYSQIYRHVEDIDLWSAAISEYALPGAILGPTLSCLIAEQFANLRRGDRFWYENSGWPSSFTPEQLDEIRKVTVGRIVCDNSDDIATVPLNTFMQGDPMRNPFVECNSHHFPHMDLTKWRDTSYDKK
ncbi:peroxidase-like isoform X1 [Argiope bruennichi]|uniref:Chorion peroxidase like protein n=1 Tax=Argiope bruennichi TaxID=94029 RepID=A0A8T0FJF2_ARGBR|nr:peroxidase-like isoform X1 [Argiope bruennichi]KAF8791141.1 Chorion peroxidase like protein [Argiope bruennichi]